MIVEDLISYFNMGGGDGESLLYPRGGRVEAWHRGLRLGSLFEPIVELQGERVVGHRAQLCAEGENGQSVDAECAYGSRTSDEEIVVFDRLCRTLHTLNFLAQRRHAGGYLQLAVHPRHLFAVPGQHGLVFEAILKRCGLAPEDIVLELETKAFDAGKHFTHAVDNYRRRGYLLALRLRREDEAKLLEALALRPDVLLMPKSFVAGEQVARESGIVRQRAAIDDDEDFRCACAKGIELASGGLFGAPSPDCLPTHKPAPKPSKPFYNPTLLSGARL